MDDNILVTILYLSCNAFRIYTIAVFMSLFYTREGNLQFVKILSYVGYFIINSAIYLIWRNPVLNLLNNLCIIFLLTLFQRTRWQTRALTTIITFSVSILVENFVAAFFQFDLTAFESSVTMVISGLLLFAIVFCIKSFTNIKEDHVSSVFHSLIISFISAISIFIAIVLIFPKLHYGQVWVGISMVLLLLMNFMVIYLYDSVRDRAKQVKARELLQQQNNLYIKQYETIFNSQESIRILRHDMKGHMSAIQCFLEKDKQQEAAAYIQNIFQTLSSVSEVVNTGNVAIDSVLNCKIREAELVNAKIQLQLKIPPRLNVLPFDLSVILVNLLDNAIKAVEKLESSDLRIIKFSLKLERGVIYINSSNPFCGALVYSGNHLKTTHCDGANHGYGLLSVQKALDKYNGVFDVGEQGQIFAVNVLLYNVSPI